MDHNADTMDSILSGSACDDAAYPEAAYDKILRFDGLYQNGCENYFYYLRFFEDGQVVQVSSTGTPEEVSRWLKRGYERSGTYALMGDRISFAIVSPVGRVRYSGVILNSETLRLDSHSEINGYDKSGAIFRFHPCSFPNG